MSWQSTSFVKISQGFSSSVNFCLTRFYSRCHLNFPIAAIRCHFVLHKYYTFNHSTCKCISIDAFMRQLKQNDYSSDSFFCWWLRRWIISRFEVSLFNFAVSNYAIQWFIKPFKLLNMADISECFSLAWRI